ncbi:phosphopentomutase [Falsiroseomonas bella]|uniref:Phosphopentomutase n=1 Tax=Falsiroseomonas bella TaxID=2184016 RepID=A0A317FEM9_9PROT|nr:phosphopentomutase [Falsiroseomonas bella]PWS37013.1 phosphopentomutase [Falsiroseomonas bella]
MTDRALIIVLDGVGVGGAPDASRYGDAGADTLGHVIAATGVLLPNLAALGLLRVMGLADAPAPRALHGRMRERSAGKDSTTGHWEIAGIVLQDPFATFPRIPDPLVAAIEREAGIRFLGNRAASGTAIIEELGAQHLRTGDPILYTSADSVLQIAAHESVIPLPRLHAICEVARRHADAYRIGRVIARPFTGAPGAFARTAHRHDYAMPPPRSVLDGLAEAGIPVTGIGKAADLFAGRGFDASHPTRDNAEGMRRIAECWRGLRRGLLFANLVDFDTEFGHRRDVAGFAAALAAFDAWLASFLPQVAPDDLVIITADHGCDPAHAGTDHTREEVPLLALHRGRADPLGTRDGFADVAATLAACFGLPSWPTGRAFLP